MRLSISFALVAVGLIVSITSCTDPTSIKRNAGTPTSSQVMADVGDDSDYVTTPAGLYHRSCVHEIEDGARAGRNGRVTRKNGTTYQLPNCLHPVRHIRHGTERSSPANNGWIEDAYFPLAAGNQYRQQTANWVVPANPVGSYSWTTGGPPVFFTFPGLQSSAFIIQPVIQYGYNGDFGSASAWVMASWHCDTGPGCTHSAPIGITAGDAMAGSVVASDCANGDCTWTITTRDVTTGQRTILAVADTENYSFAAGGAVEVYRL